MRSLPTTIALGALMSLTACASDGDSAPSAGTSLRIVVTLEEGGEPQETLELECDPPGGEHPQPKQACAALDEAGAAVFRPIPDEQPCTALYGGPQTAKVTGTYAGTKVDATFSRENGCEIDRWDSLGTTFFDVPML